MKHPSIRHKINFFFWSRIHKLPRVFINWWQLRQLKRTVAEAFFNVPYYSKLYAESGVKPEDIKTLEDIPRLPVTKKSLFQLISPEDLTNSRFNQYSIKWDGTSGSTGEPFKFPDSRNHYFLNLFGPRSQPRCDILSDRFLLWLGLSSAFIYENIRLAKFRQLPKPRGKWCLSISLPELRDNPEQVVKDVHNFKPDVMEGRATILAEFARLCESLPKHMRPLPQFALTAGEILTPTCRKYIEEVLDTEVYDLYGLQETSNIGCECREHDGFHIYEESCFVEILDREDKPVPKNTKGGIVVTHFLNDALPFIRYDTGDLGYIRYDPCSCGLPNPRLYVEGREGRFVSIGERRYHTHEFEYTMRTQFTNIILRYQFVKVSKDKIELHIVPAGIYSNLAGENLQKNFLQLFGFTPEIKIVDTIPYTKEGKTLTVTDKSEEGN